MICNKLIASFTCCAIITAGIGGYSFAEKHVAVPQKRPAPQGQAAKTATSPTNAGTVKEAKPAPKYQSACPALLNKLVDAKYLPPIVDNGCGEKSPIALTALNYTDSSSGPFKTNLSSAPNVTCGIASAVADWGIGLNITAHEIFGARVTTIISGNGYQCRRRNNLPDGKISEHGFANAIDILGFELSTGEKILVETHWGDPSTELDKNAKFLREIHQSACKKFTTVLGPETNEYHKDHFHFDLGCHGKSCTYKLCE